MGYISGAGATNIDLLYKDIKRLPGVGEEVYTKNFSLQLGGGLPATLINLSRLNIETRIATELGDDLFSDFARSEFESAGAHPFNLYRGNEIPLNITSAVILPSDRSFITYSKGELDNNDYAKEMFYRCATGSKLCYIQYGGFIDVFEQLKKEGTVLVLDTGWDDELSFEKYGDYIRLADYYTPNQKEAMKITKTDNPYDALEALGEHFEKPIVKLDKDGCIGAENGEVFKFGIIDEFKNVDSTGAGDAFLAGFMYGLYHSYPLKECVLFGNITGGKCVTKAGALSAYCNEKELLEYKEKYEYLIK